MPDDITRRTALKRTAALLGGIVSAPVWGGVLSGCSTPSGDDYTPVFFSPDRLDMLGAASDVLLPETDTPGARAVGVHRFIDTMVGESFLEPQRQTFTAGLDALDDACQSAYGAPFAACTVAEQSKEIARLDEEAFGEDAPLPDPDAPVFFRMLKELVLIGYYTSEVGATEELRTSIVPGNYDGDVPYDEIGRAWAGYR